MFASSRPGGESFEFRSICFSQSAGAFDGTPCAQGRRQPTAPERRGMECVRLLQPGVPGLLRPRVANIRDERQDGCSRLAVQRSPVGVSHASVSGDLPRAAAGRRAGGRAGALRRGADEPCARWCMVPTDERAAHSGATRRGEQWSWIVTSFGDQTPCTWHTARRRVGVKHRTRPGQGNEV